MNGNQDKFQYTYSAPSERERAEIERIRAEYRPDERAEKYARLRRLNARVRRAATGRCYRARVRGCQREVRTACSGRGTT